MAKTQEFQEWFVSHYFNRDQFEAEARAGFQDIQDATAGWAANGLMMMLNGALGLMDEGEQYLEIGTYGGRSLAGALRNNDKLAQVIDPFLNTGDVRPKWEKAVDDFGVRERIVLHEVLSEEFEGQLPTIGVFFYDGNHDSGHTYEGLKRFEQYLSDRAIIVVDDYAIPGGDNQYVYPGHTVHPLPVKRDTDRWLAENADRAKLFMITPWTYQQAVIIYEAN